MCLSDGSRRRGESARFCVGAVMSPYFDATSARSTVDAHRRGVHELIRGVKGMSTSKAFRARLELRDNEVPVLQMWAVRHCALHACFRSDRGTIVLVALRAAPQTSASFGRTIRNALRRCGVSSAGLRGHWFSCITVREVISVCLSTAEHTFPDAALRAEEQRCFRGSHSLRSALDDSDERAVELFR